MDLATLIGALAGEALGDPRTFGLDAAVPAAFLALMWPRLSSTRTRATAVAAAALALSVVPFLRPGLPILAAAGVAVLAATLPESSGAELLEEEALRSAPGASTRDGHA